MTESKTEKETNCMNIGTEQPTRIVEPIRSPVPARTAPQKAPAPAPARPAPMPRPAPARPAPARPARPKVPAR